MNYTEKYGHRISALTLGTVQLGLAYGVNNDKGMPSYGESAAILDRALELGITSFDTARAYGESEEVLGRYFKDKKSEVTLISKAAIYDAPKSEIRQRMLDSVHTSLEKLGIEKLPFLKLHNESMLITYGDKVINVLQDLKKEGLVSGIGVSFSDKSRLRELTDGVGFDCIQLPANIFDNEVIVDGTIKRLYDGGSAVFVRSVYLQGLFFKDTSTLPDKLRVAKEPLDRLHKLAKEAQISMAELAITFIRDTEGIASLVMGCDNPEQLSQSVSLIDSPKIAKDVRDEAMKIAQSVPEIVIRPWEWNK